MQHGDAGWHWAAGWQWNRKGHPAMPDGQSGVRF